VLKFQQFTGPIMAKGVEDTAFYIYNRLVALNEVGGEPQQFGLSADAFHERNADRQRDWPATLLGTSTHDTKRSEDARARIVAISEMPELWRQSLQRWRTANRRWKRQVSEAEAPDADEEYLLYQSLLGTWPVEQSGAASKNASAEYTARIQAYMAKALNEAKLNTSWIQPNEACLAAMHDFVAGILDATPKNKFLPIFRPVVEEIARIGAINSLSQTLLKLTSPGVPDIYQGNEIWNLALVDPDNRRPIDYKRRREMLAALAKVKPEEVLQNCPDDRIKMFLTQRLLRFRNEHVDLFRQGNYFPIKASGTFADCCIGFARELDGQWVVVVAPRLSSRIGFPPVGERWKDTVVDFPESLAVAKVRELFTGREIRVQDRQLKLAEALSILPFAVISNYKL
jgi:(1->4)-alpha-D-glucan 1-alpha-D-glucosylmutase